QDSSVLREAHQALYESNLGKEGEKFNALTETDKIKAIQFHEHNLYLEDNTNPLIKDTLDIIRNIKKMQASGGEKAIHRFIISNCQQASDILQLMELFLWSGWKMDELKMDFVPLFETVDDLQRASKIMEV